MKRNFTLFTIVQLFFLVTFALSAQVASKDVNGLQPFNSEQETVHINLNQTTTINKIKQLAQTETLNISIYDWKSNNYYVYFSEESNPNTIFGVSTKHFLHNEFLQKTCASTDLTKNCAITLSKPDKTNDISIFSLDTLPENDNVTNITLYPNNIKSNEEMRLALLAVFPDATFKAQISGGNRALITLVGVFIVANMFLLVTTIQTLYKRGKSLALKKLFGEDDFTRIYLPLSILLLPITTILFLVYLIVYHYITFDWSYIWLVAIYCIVVGVLFITALSYHLWQINKKSVNVLIKGMLGTKLLMITYVGIAVLLLIVTADTLLTPSVTLRQLAGEYKRLDYYTDELKSSATLPFTRESLLLFIQHDSSVSAKHQIVIDKLAPYIELKNHGQIFAPIADKPSFATFNVNKNFVINKISDKFRELDFDNENKVYIFSKKIAEQQAEISALRDSLSMNRDVEIIVLPYENDALHEYVSDMTYMQAGRGSDYIDIEHPIYVLEGGPVELWDIIFTQLYAGGYYVALESQEAKALWQEIPTFLQTIDASQYYSKQTTLYDVLQKQIEEKFSLLYRELALLVISFASGLYLIYIFLEEYFAYRRKELVLKRIFGLSFFTRYGHIFGLISVVFMATWIRGTYLSKEWEFINILSVVVVFIGLNTSIYWQIKKLEKTAMNIVIKE